MLPNLLDGFPSAVAFLFLTLILYISHFFGIQRSLATSHSSQTKQVVEGKNSANLPDFWPSKDTITDLSTLDIDWFPEEEVVGEPLTQMHLYYQSHNDVRIHALYIRPSSLPEETIPGMVLVHGGGNNHLQMLPLAKYLARTINYGIMCIDSPGVTSSGGWVSTGPAESRENILNVLGPEGPSGSFYYHNVMAILRAITVLQSLPEIDESRVGLGSFSGGSIAAFIANGIESRYQRLKFAVNIAAAGDWSHEDFKTSQMQSWLSFDWGTEQTDEFMQFYDPIIYAALAHAPTLMLFGTNDEYFPQSLFKRTFEALPDPKALTLLPGYGHWQLLPKETNYVPVKTWIQAIANGMELYPIPSIDQVKPHNNGSITIDLALVSDPRIDEIGLSYNSRMLDSPRDWLTEKQGLKTGKEIYSWTINVQNAAEYAFYPSIFSEGVLLFSAPLVFNTEIETYLPSTASKSPVWSFFGLLSAILSIGKIRRCRKR